MIIAVAFVRRFIDPCTYHRAFRHSKLDDLESFGVVRWDGFDAFTLFVDTTPSLAFGTRQLAFVINTLVGSRHRNQQQQEDVSHRIANDANALTAQLLTAKAELTNYS